MILAGSRTGGPGAASAALAFGGVIAVQATTTNKTATASRKGAKAQSICAGSRRRMVRFDQQIIFKYSLRLRAFA
jgi:hypothetical protein